MLQITVPEKEYWNELTEEFVKTKKQSLSLEHSLVSISKWEAKWQKPFISSFNEKLSTEEIVHYIKCMTLTQNVDPQIYYSLSRENYKDIYEYINNPMTATTFSDKVGKRSRELVTSELIYFWMVQFNIPFECQKWHLNRLLTLVRICSIKNQPQKKRSRREIMADYKRINEERKKEWNTKG